MSSETASHRNTKQRHNAQDHDVNHYRLETFISRYKPLELH